MGLVFAWRGGLGETAAGVGVGCGFGFRVEGRVGRDSSRDHDWRRLWVWFPLEIGVWRDISRDGRRL